MGRDNVREANFVNELEVVFCACKLVVIDRNVAGSRILFK